MSGDFCFLIIALKSVNDITLCYFMMCKPRKSNKANTQKSHS
jgi:hypothetical protein